MFALLQQRSIQTIIALLLYTCLAAHLPLVVHQSFYTASLFIKDLLIWIMPLTVGFFIANTVAGFQRKAPWFALTIILFEVCSNFSGVWYSYICGQTLMEYLPSFQPTAFEGSFHALWHLPFSRPSWWTADKGCLVGVMIGFYAAFSNQTGLLSLLSKGKDLIQMILTKIFGRIIPLFVLGLASNMYYSGVLRHVISNYGVLMLWLIFVICLYIFIVAFIGTGGSFPQTIRHIHNLLPAGMIALSSSCSLSTMPWTIKGTGKNLNDPALAGAVIPATSNIQLVGDCIVNAFLCFFLYQQFFGIAPTMAMWFTFTSVYVLARFATSAVLGGVIFVMIPIYEYYLHFTPAMIAIIYALNVVLDPLITCANVLANGALCRLFEIVWTKVKNCTVATAV